MLIMDHNTANRLQCQNLLSESVGTHTKLFTFHTEKKAKLMYFEYINSYYITTDSDVTAQLGWLVTWLRHWSRSKWL